MEKEVGALWKLGLMVLGAVVLAPVAWLGVVVLCAADGDGRTA